MIISEKQILVLLQIAQAHLDVCNKENEAVISRLLQDIATQQSSKLKVIE